MSVQPRSGLTLYVLAMSAWDKPKYERMLQIEKRYQKSDLYNGYKWISVVFSIISILGCVLLYIHPWSTYHWHPLYEKFSIFLLATSIILILGALLCGFKSRILARDFNSTDKFHQSLIHSQFFGGINLHNENCKKRAEENLKKLYSSAQSAT